MGQTARNRGHEVSAEIKKKKKTERRGNPCTSSRGSGGGGGVGVVVDVAGRRGLMVVVGMPVLGATQSTCGCQHLRD